MPYYPPPSSGSSGSGYSAVIPTALSFQNQDRATSTQTNSSAVSSGTMRMAAIWLPSGTTVTSIGWLSGATALNTAGTGPHFWVALYNSSLALLRQSTDDTAATWAANTLKLTALSSAYVTTYAGTHYLALNVVSGSTGTQPTLTAMNSSTAILSGLSPIVHGVSSTGLGATAPDPAGAITASASTPYCGVV